MNTSDFKEWLEFFDAAFPSYAEKRVRMSNKLAIESMWQRDMGDVELGKAKVATESARRGDIGEIKDTTAWDKYPAIIRRRAKDMEYQNAGRGAVTTSRMTGPDGEPTYSCAKCQDTGLVEVVSQKSIDDSKNFDVWMDVGVVWPAMAACSCKASEKFSAWKNLSLCKRADMRQAIDYPGILDRPRTLVAWRNWLLEQVRKSYEWNPDSQPTEYNF